LKLPATPEIRNCNNEQYDAMWKGTMPQANFRRSLLLLRIVLPFLIRESSAGVQFFSMSTLNPDVYRVTKVSTLRSQQREVNAIGRI
jgi:hypothetical protein